MGYIVKKTVIMPVLASLVLLFAACGAKNGVSDAGEAHLHEFGEWKVVKKASCTQDGLKVRVCACGEIRCMDIRRTGHKYDAEETVLPNCTEYGLVTFTCVYCGDTYTEATRPLGHDLDEHNTCMIRGKSVLKMNEYKDFRKAEIILPDLPETVSCGGKSAFRVDEVYCELYGQDEDGIIIYFSGEKTYDSAGDGKKDRCEIGWKLYGADGNAVAEGIFRSEPIKVGESIKDGKDYAFNCIQAYETYSLELFDVD